MTTLVAGWLWLLRSQTDPLTALLAKYIEQPDKRPVRDVYGDWRHTDFHTLVVSFPAEHLALFPWDIRSRFLDMCHATHKTISRMGGGVGVLIDTDAKDTSFSFFLVDDKQLESTGAHGP